MEFSAHAAFRDKLRAGPGAAQPHGASGDPRRSSSAGLLLIERRRKRRAGTEQAPAFRKGESRARGTFQWKSSERSGSRTLVTRFTDAEGHRCSAKRFLTIEHIDPFAKGGPTTVDNCCLLCRPHNAHRARQVFGEDHIQNKISEARARRRQSTPPSADARARGRRVRKGARSAGSDGVQASGRAASRRASAPLRGGAAARADASRDARHSHTLRRFGHTPTKGVLGVPSLVFVSGSAVGTHADEGKELIRASNRSHSTQSHRHAGQTLRRRAPRRGPRPAQPVHFVFGASRQVALSRQTPRWERTPPARPDSLFDVAGSSAGRSAARCSGGREQEPARGRAADRGAHARGAREARHPTSCSGHYVAGRARSARARRRPPGPARCDSRCPAPQGARAQRLTLRRRLARRQGDPCACR